MEAIGKALPIWKALGGVLPMDALQPMWDAIPEKEALFEVEVTALLKSEAGEKTVSFQLHWQ